MSTKSRTRVAGKSLRKAGVGGAALTLAAATALAGAGVANANATFTFNRIAGPDRYDTAAQVDSTFGPSTNAILASGEAGHTVDALSAAQLAGVKQAPILLTRLGYTPQVTLNQLAASGVKNITIVGGVGAVNEAQADALRALGYNVTREGGIDRYATSAAVIAASGAPSGTTALLASGTVFADALGAGSLSYAKDIPVGITKPATLSPETVTAFQNAGIKNVLIVGGAAAVNPAVTAQLIAAGFTVDNTTLAGMDRSETSVRLAQLEVANYGFSKAAINVAAGTPALDGADALGGDALSGQQLRPLLITVNTNDAGVLPTYLKANCTTLATGSIFGDTGAVSQAVQDQLTAAATCAPPVVGNQTFTVTPTTPQTVNVGTQVAYTISGLGTAPVDVQLFNCNNVQNNGGVVTFTGTAPGQATGNIAQNGTLGASTVEANPAQGQAPATILTGLTPVNGTLNLLVTSTTPGQCVVPVVYTQGPNTAPGGGNSLVLGANNQPTASFGAGGQATFINAAPAGTALGGTVTSANQTSFTESGNTFVYNANDIFQLANTTSPNAPTTLTLAQFQQLLTQGDQVVPAKTGSYNPPGQSTFLLQDLAPEPSNVNAVPSTKASGGVDVTFSPAPAAAGVPTNVTSYNVYRATANKNPTGSLTPFTCPTTPAAGQSPQVAPTAPYTNIGTVPASAANPITGNFTFTDPTPSLTGQTATTGPVYCYLVTAVGPNAAGATQEGTGVPATGNPVLPSTANATSLAPMFAAAITNSVTITQGANGLPATANIVVNYTNGPLNTGTVDLNGSDYTAVYTDSNGTAHTLTPVNATGLGSTVTITATAANGFPVTAGTLLLTAKNGTDGNTVTNIAAAPLNQPVGDAVVITN